MKYTNHLFLIPLELYDSIIYNNHNLIISIKDNKQKLNMEIVNTILISFIIFNHYLILNKSIQEKMLKLFHNPFFGHKLEYSYKQLSLNNNIELLEKDWLSYLYLELNQDENLISVTYDQLKEFYILNDFKYINKENNVLIKLPFFMALTSWFYSIKELDKYMESSSLDKDIKIEFLNKIHQIRDDIEILNDFLNFEFFNIDEIKDIKDINKTRMIHYFHNLYQLYYS